MFEVSWKQKLASELREKFFPIAVFGIRLTYVENFEPWRLNPRFWKVGSLQI